VLTAQQDPNYKEIKLKLTYLDTLLSTDDKFIIQNSDLLIIDNKNLIRYSDYVLNYRNGTIAFSSELFRKYSLDTNRIYDLTVRYDLFPYSIKEEYSIFDIKIERDTLTGDTLKIATTTEDVLGNFFEGTDLQRSGSLFRGFTIGTNRDISLNSGFNLQLNGKLTNDIDVTAALTDENTPIQPEGNTQKLQELDKVFIELRSSTLGATIGDIDVNMKTSEFLNFNRKIQGAKGSGNFDRGNFLFSGAISRGKFNSNAFNGSDGLQGPYRLVGKDNEVNIIVLSGTEKVYIDGILMTRGEQADYIIDYGLGTITFMNKRMITNASRIVVDFEYSDRQYNRTLLVGNGGYKFFSNKLKLDVSYVNEADNKDKTVDITLSDTDKVILENAGADRNKAVRSGESYVGRDSLNRGLGYYIKIDTLIGGSPYTIYRYAPGDSIAVYNVVFTFVGAGKGDYKSISTYQYSFEGINKGSYAPIILLPVPTSYQVGTLTLDYAINKNRELYVKVESAYSMFNPNQFSNTYIKKEGFAINGEAGFRKNNFRMLGINFRNASVMYKERMIDKKFTSLDRINSVEFYRNFDLTDTSTSKENYRSGTLQLDPGKYISIQGNFSQLVREDFFNSLRFSGTFDFNPSSIPDFNRTLPIIRYSAENISSDNSGFNQKGSWFKQFAYAGYRKYLSEDKNSTYLEISSSLNNENRESSVNVNGFDSLSYDSFAFLEIVPRVSLTNLASLTLFSEFNYRNDDFPVNGELTNISKSLIQRYGLQYSGIKWVFADFDFSIRDKNYTQPGINLNNQDNKTVLMNSRLRVSPLSSAVTGDVLYSVSSERTAITQKVFVLVPVGQGNYIYLGDLNNNGIQDENEFQLTNFDGNYIKLNLPTDQYFPTVDLKTSFRVNLKPSRYYFANGQNVVNEIYNNLSAETYVRIDEQSKDPNSDNIYFLHLDTFLNDSNTMAGAQLLQQDVNLFENNPDYSLRLRFQQLKGYNQYSSGNERSLNIQRSARLRLGLVRDLSFQVEYISRNDRNTAPVNSIRNRDISGSIFNSDIAYRPVVKIESGIQFNFSNSDDTYPEQPLKATTNQQILRFIYSLTSSGRLRFEAERFEVILNRDETNFPYELTAGRPAGKSYYWRAFFDYSISKNIQASINYDGRSEGGKKVINTGRAQVTAFF
jgi:hypothetical protein